MKLKILYQLCVASFLMPRAMLGVLFPYIITVHLLETPERIGIAITASMLPSLFVLLFAGAIADRFNKRMVLIILHIFNAVPVFVLTALLAYGYVTFEVMVLFALVSGAAIAFIQPTLDGMLNHIETSNVTRGVNMSVATMYIVTLLGFGAASAIEWVGLVPLLLFSSILFSVGILVTLQLPNTSLDVGRKKPILTDIKDGIKMALGNARLRMPVLLMSSAGLLLGGPYAVLLPIILRDTYNASGVEFALAFAMFMVGGVTSSGMLLWLKEPRQLIKLLIAGYGLGGIALLCWASTPSFWLFMASIAFWGFGGGICLNVSRSILQKHAPPTHKSRILSVMYLGDEGGAPIGSLIIGLLIAALGAATTAFIPGLLIVIISIVLFAFAGKRAINDPASTQA